MAQKRGIISQEPAPQLPDNLLTAEEVQQRLKIGRKQLLQLIVHEGLPVIRWGYRTLRFHPDALARWLAEQAM